MYRYVCIHKCVHLCCEKIFRGHARCVAPDASAGQVEAAGPAQLEQDRTRRTSVSIDYRIVLSSFPNRVARVHPKACSWEGRSYEPGAAGTRYNKKQVNMYRYV